ncbi:splicing factor-like protein 1 [Quercus robur]|uniref:splicing factor-like protein 1 n=1 Tax=Quercus robur TaxID=38942 RepID=UPI002162DCAA|nr:splicing factor-like protein 1 [Quercus robur]XP_050254323.1 splicing factor-like protein 1 [Quercus robur]XP_050254324.1 splicing factor-like protein 1 [Quercus robur]XP_050254325.1 splicing factor-like protein 1 [Quercus robur]XP_050254326.1 splicing factor-like protein 1 [Quercus robur]
MRNHNFSQVSRNAIKENKTNQRLEEKAVLVSAAGKCLPQSSSDRCYIANEPLEEDPEEEPSEVEEDPEEKPSEVEEDPEEEPSEVEEDPEEESVEEIGNKLEKEPSDDLEEDPIEELEQEPSKVLLEQIEEPSECDAQSYFNHSNNGSEEPVENALEASPAECHSGTDPNNSYKKRSLDASIGESVALQGYLSQEKCRQEESLKPESESSYAAPHFHSQSGLAMTLGDKCSSEQQEGTGSSRKRRHSRWEKVENDQASKRKKTRWISDDLQLKLLGPLQLPDLGKEFVVGSDLDSEIQELQAELADINRKLQTSKLHDDKPMEERSPSPEPMHDNLGIRLNPRQVRLHQKLVQKRQHIISKLIKKNSTFKPPLEYKSSKLCKKIYIPVKEYPNYNFVGLIIGPLGKTQKRMEKETGAKIRLRGKDKTTNPQKNDEDLHVYIEADNQKSLDAAVGMVEKLLNPIDDAMNEHKRVQLEELATLKANMCRICHEHGHHYFACPQRQSTFKMVCCDKCGSYKHPTETCEVIAMSPQSKSGQGSRSSLGSTTKTQDRPNKEIDNTNLYVNHLPENVDDNRLLEFFSPFGKITKARVIRNQTTGISKGYGFVKFENQIDAAAAMAHLNGCRMDGHMLAVRIAGVPPGSLFSSHLSPYQGPPPIFPNVTSQIAWPGWIPGSILPVPLTPVPISNGMNLHSSSIFVEHGNVLKNEGLGFTPASGLSSLSDLPGCSSLHSSSNSSNQIQSSSGGLITQFPGDPDYPSSGFESYF